jgi:peptide/nickel transport system permease protein
MSEQPLSPPSWEHWFGTDVVGNDVFAKCLAGVGLEVTTLLAVVPAVAVLGTLVGLLLSFFQSGRLRECLVSFVYYWATLPILLIAVFLLIFVGAGQLNVVAILIFVLVPGHSLYVYSQITEAKKRDFVVAKKSYGLRSSRIFLRHLLPYASRSIITYTMSRLPEVLMLNLALNFLGLGVQPPRSSFGRLLVEGLSFMFSAWWLWVFAVASVVLLFVAVNYVASGFARGVMQCATK